MLHGEPPLSPPESFGDMLLRIKMSEEEYFKYLDEVEELKINIAYLEDEYEYRYS